MPSKNTNSEYFDQFWEASSYSDYNLKELAAAQEIYSSIDEVDSLLEYPAKPTKIKLPKNQLNKLAKKRKSERKFGKNALSQSELSTLLSSFYAINGLEHRAYPSAGASYSLEVFCIANNIDDYKQKIIYYNPDQHAINIIGPAPKWSSVKTKINVQTEGTPQCMIIFVIFPDRLTAKYQERGGRFALIETGAALQQLALQIAGSKKLKGVAVGALNDDFWLKTLGLKTAEAKIALGYLVGK